MGASLQAMLVLVLVLACADPAVPPFEPVALPEAAVPSCDTGAALPWDDDGDGSHHCEDCDDGDPLVHPGAVDECGNGLDDDCDGLSPCGLPDPYDLDAAPSRLIGVEARTAVYANSTDANGDGLLDVLFTDALYGVRVVESPFPPGVTQWQDIDAGKLTACYVFDAGDLDGDGLGDVVCSQDVSIGVGAVAWYLAPLVGDIGGDDAFGLVFEPPSGNTMGNPRVLDAAEDPGQEVLVAVDDMDRSWCLFAADAGEYSALDAVAEIQVSDFENPYLSYVGILGSGDMSGDGISDILGSAGSRPAGWSDIPLLGAILGPARGFADYRDLVIAPLDCPYDDPDSGVSGHGSPAVGDWDGDLDGDGYSDIVVGTSFCRDVEGYTSGSAGATLEFASGPVDGSPERTATLWPSEVFDVYRDVRHVGDVDGDGEGDLFVWSDYPTVSRLLYGPVEGTGYIEDHPGVVFEGLETSSTNQWSTPMGDTNGDGFSDFAIVRRTPPDATQEDTGGYNTEDWINATIYLIEGASRAW